MAIDWHKGEGDIESFDDMADQIEANLDPDYDPFLDQEDNLMEEEAAEIFSIGTIRAQLPVENKSYRDLLDQVNELIFALENHQRIERVDVISLPVDVRSHKSFLDRTGAVSDRDDNEAIDGRFAIRVIMRGRSNV